MAKRTGNLEDFQTKIFNSQTEMASKWFDIAKPQEVVKKGLAQARPNKLVYVCYYVDSIRSYKLAPDLLRFQGTAYDAPS